MLNIKALGVRGDGITDDAQKINEADARLSASGGGVLMFAPGVYIAGSSLVRNPNVVWQGAGVGSTIIRQKAGTNLSSLVQTKNAYSLFGTGSVEGPPAISFRDMCFDGNKAQGCHGDGIAIYAPLFSIDHIEVCNATGFGVRTEFGVPGVVPHGYSAQSSMNNSWVHDCDIAGVMWAGPSDCSLVNVQIYRNRNYNLWLAGPQGSGTKVINCHCWGSIFDDRLPTTSARLDSGGNLLINNVFEGGTVHQVHMRSTGNVLVGGNIYYLSDPTTPAYGVTLGDSGMPVSSNTIATRIDNCRGGAIYLANSQGQNHINVQGWNTGQSIGLQGIPAISDHVHMQVAGDAVTNGQITHLAGMGLVSLAAANSGGSGYRALRVPN